MENAASQLARIGAVAANAADYVYLRMQQSTE
jgi:hypothetical protein